MPIIPGTFQGEFGAAVASWCGCVRWNVGAALSRGTLDQRSVARQPGCVPWHVRATVCRGPFGNHRAPSQTISMTPSLPTQSLTLPQTT